MQRVANLEAQVAALTAENTSLKARTNGNGHQDTSKLIEAVGSQIDRSGQILREDFTGKLAALIAPYIDSTIRRCAEVEKQQGELEKKFEQHRKAVGGSAAEMEAAFIKVRKEAAKDWKAQRDLIQSDFGHVDEFIKWFTSELQKNAQRNNGAVASCNLAVERCKELAEKVGVPVEKIIERLRVIEAQGKEAINRAEQQLTKAYHNLREPVLTRATVLICSTIVINLAFAAFTLWGARRAIDTNWQELTEHSEQQKQDTKELLDKALAEAKEAQIGRESKVKMWDALMKTLTQQQRDALWGQVRDQMRKDGEKCLDDQMSAGYDQMNGKRK
jgi:hypothetical protein